MELESLQCPICLDTFNNPTTIACGHSFCIEHIVSLKTLVSQGPSFSLKCPFCTVVHVYDKELSVNYTLKSILEELSTKSEGNKGKIKMEEIEKPKIKRLKEDGVWGKETCKMFQQFLSAHGEPLVNDGNFGIISVCALQKFIGTHGILPVDGFFGEMTAGALQKWLNQSGFPPGPIDGFFSKQSTKALQRWLNHEQGNDILKVDGIFGILTSSVFQSVLETKGYKTGGADEFEIMSVKALQRFLNDRGCCYIIVDGDWGKVTTFAVQTWLKKNNEQPGPVDGHWGSKSCLALQRLLNKWITGEKQQF